MNWSSILPDRAPLNDEEVRDLISQAQAGNLEARNFLVENNLRLVVSIANRFENRGIEMEDLYQIGSIGLVKAIDDFDLSYDVKFSTYAVPKIIGEIKRYLRESSPLRISRSLKDLAHRGLKMKDQLTNELGRTPTVGEIASRLNVASEELMAALEAVAPVQSLQQIVHEGEGEPLLLEDQIATIEDDQSFLINDLLSKLELEERRLVLLRYFAEKSQTEVAAALGISQSQVSRLEKRILAELKKQL